MTQVSPGVSPPNLSQVGHTGLSSTMYMTNQPQPNIMQQMDRQGLMGQDLAFCIFECRICNIYAGGQSELLMHLMGYHAINLVRDFGRVINQFGFNQMKNPDMQI